MFSHPLGRLVFPLIKCWDYGRADLVVMAALATPDPMTAEIVKAARSFDDLAPLSVAEHAAAIGRHDLDVLVWLDEPRRDRTLLEQLPALARAEVEWLGSLGRS